MSPQVLLPSPPAINRRLPRERRKVGEVAGGATAECVAVSCCCPCAVMDLVVLTVYKVPAGLCKKAIHKNNRQRTQKNKESSSNSHSVLLQRPSNSSTGSDDNEKTTLEEHLSKIHVAAYGGEVTEYGDLEKELRAHFNGTGFWRSPSRRQQ